MRTWWLAVSWLAVCWLAAVVTSGCVSAVNPDEGRFACAAATDCGAGWECRPQLVGGGRCHKAGSCLDAEACNGLDDDCNGAVDDGFDLSSDSAHCGACDHPCRVGTSCLGSSCREASCDDGLDNDLDGRADCTDEACLGLACTPPDGGHCGALRTDGGQPDADAGVDGGQTLQRGCFPPEHVCDDGADDDGDGLVDCGDPDCDGRLCHSGTTCAQRTCPGPG